MRTTLRTLAFAAAAAVIATACTPSHARESAPRDTDRPPPARPTATMVARGEYIVNTAACHDCHTPKVMTPTGPVLDRTRLLSGHRADETLPSLPAGVIAPDAWGAVASQGLTAWRGPWGTSFAANLTPDATGLAGWTDSLFIATIRTGKHLGSGRPILPPMPWEVYAQLTDDDLRAVFAYLQSLPAVANKVPQPEE